MSTLDELGQGQPPATLTISNAGTNFINGVYRRMGKGKMMKYSRSCLHPLSKVPFRLEIVRKPLFDFTGTRGERYVIQAYRNVHSKSNKSQKSKPSSSSTDTVIDYYVSDQFGKWQEIAGLAPTPQMSLDNNNQQSGKQKQKQKQKQQQKQQKSKQQATKTKEEKADDTVTTSASLHNNGNSDDSKIEATKKTYLTDTYQFIYNNNCQIVGLGNDSKYGDYVILNDTIFHAQGGGQPSDIGIITSKDGKIVFNVTFVAHNGKLIYHYGKYSDECIANDRGFNINDEIIEKVDEKTRTENAKCHSAGHLLDIGLSLIGKGCHVLKPLKGYHFVKGSYVEYQGNVDTKEREQVRLDLQNQLNSMIEKEVNSKVVFYEKEEYCEKYIEEWGEYSDDKKKNILDSLHTEFGKIRVITWDVETWFGGKNGNKKMSDIPLGELGCMCGGTHIDNTRRIKEIQITKLKKKGKNIRVMYTVI